jgi:hypothetical protein
MVLWILLDGGPSHNGPLLGLLSQCGVVPWVPILIMKTQSRMKVRVGPRLGWRPSQTRKVEGYFITVTSSEA